jgi:hypothetical protein
MKTKFNALPKTVNANLVARNRKFVLSTVRYVAVAATITVVGNVLINELNKKFDTPK